jgi:hypothetical protein
MYYTCWSIGVYCPKDMGHGRSSSLSGSLHLQLRVERMTPEAVRHSVSCLSVAEPAADCSGIAHRGLRGAGGQRYD